MDQLGHDPSSRLWDRHDWGVEMTVDVDYKDYTGVAGWEVARWLRRLQDEGISSEQIAKATQARWSCGIIDTTALSRIVGDRERDRLGKNCPTVVSLHFIDRVVLAVDDHLSISSLRVICCPTASAARKLAQDELSMTCGWTPRDIAQRASILLDESEAHITLGDPRYIPRAMRSKRGAPSSVMLAV